MATRRKNVFSSAENKGRRRCEGNRKNMGTFVVGRRLQKDMLTSRRALAFLPLRFKKNGSGVKRAERDDF